MSERQSLHVTDGGFVINGWRINELEEQVHRLETTLRAMQGKEQSSAATPSGVGELHRLGAGFGGDDRQTYPCGCTANGPGKLPTYCPIHGAAPPPPEDALLREIDAEMRHRPPGYPLTLLKRARDRIAADAVALGRAPRDAELSRERLLYLIRQDFDCLPECDSYGHAEKCPYVGGPHQLDELTRQSDAAEARTQGLEAGLRNILRGHSQPCRCWVCAYAEEALARPEPEGGDG